MSLSPPAVLLACAHVLLSHGWCQGCRAQDEHGIQCSPLGPRAVAWDIEGALQRAAYCVLGLPMAGSVYAEPAYQAARVALIAACPLSGSRPPRRWAADSLLADYNDHADRTLPEILALIDQAFNSFDRQLSDGSDPSDRSDRADGEIDAGERTRSSEPA